MKNVSPTKQKILLLLFGGLDFGYSYTPGKQWRVLKEISYNWKKIDREELRKNINQLYQTKLIKRCENSDGSCTMTLTEKGRMRALTFHFDDMKIKGEDWDGKWRLVIFDIPERLKRERNAFRSKIKEIGFIEFQKSVWVFPYKCKDEIDYVIEFYNLRRYVRFGVLESVDNEIHLKKIFNIK